MAAMDLCAGWSLQCWSGSRRRRRRLGEDMCIARPGEMRGSGVDNMAEAKARSRRGGSQGGGTLCVTSVASVLSAAALLTVTTAMHDLGCEPHRSVMTYYCPHLIPLWKRVCSSVGAAGILSV